MVTEQDFPLPPLHPFLKLYQAPSSDGEPVWSLHHPASNAYYRLTWAEFECLARFSRATHASGLKKLVETETTVRVSLAEIQGLVAFLHTNGLLAYKGEHVAFQEKSEPLWKKILHGYLYFTIPLFKPEKFLTAALPFVRPLMSRTFITIMMTLLMVASVMTLQRLDEFLHSFSRLFTLEGVVLGLLVLGFVKVVHEFAHAFTAVKYGVSVPHMGVAMIVMYPVLYTETTGSWKLSSRRERFHIGVAGITAELCLASIFLLLWNIMPAGGIGQSLAFTVVAVSLVSSLLVNLNPLMRFDGYYMMGDLTGIENLQTRSCNFARWKLREWLFALKDEEPEYLPREKRNFLITFGFALLVYRFFLFLGIALLVYHIFFKPLGLLLMLIELGWFIVLPVWSELKVWWNRRADIAKARRARILGAAIACLAVFLILPVQSTVYIPGVLHAEKYTALYPYAPSHIEEIMAKEGESVSEGQALVRLASSELDKDIAAATANLQNLKQLQRGLQANPERPKDKYASIELEIETRERMLDALQEQKDNLLIVAPFAGQVRDMDPMLKPGMYVKKSDLLMRIVAPDAQIVTGYILEEDNARIEQGSKGTFIPDSAPFTSLPVVYKTRGVAAVENMTWAELASGFGGPVAADHDTRSGRLVPLRSVYEIELAAELPDNARLLSTVQKGEIRIEGQRTSAFLKFINRLGGLLRREIGLN